MRLLLLIGLVALVTGLPATAQESYRDSLVVDDLHLTSHTSFLDEKVTVLNGRLRNAGQKTIARVDMILFFVDTEGRDIGEEHLIAFWYGKRFGLADAPIRPNYVHDFRLPLDNAPSTWGGREYRLELAEIEFLDGDEEQGNLMPPSPRGMIIPPANPDLQGVVTVRVFVDRRGRVVPDSTVLVPPTGDQAFNRRLIREVAEWIFRPATRNFRPVAAWFEYQIVLR